MLNQCTAEVRVHIGQKFPSYVRCSRRALKGEEKCWQHHRIDMQQLGDYSQEVQESLSTMPFMPEGEELPSDQE